MALSSVAAVHLSLRVGKKTQAYIGLGSNLQNPIEQIQQAFSALAELAQSRLVLSSSLYSSRPMGPQDQPDYVNAVAQIETQLAPIELLHALQSIENQQGRVRERRWGERTLDLDLLVYGDQSINHPELIVPHIGMAQRNFVLYPLQEIAADLSIPQQGLLSELIKACPQDDLQRLPSSD